MEKFEGEDEMLEKYEVYMKMLQLFKDLPSSRSWKDMLEMPYCKEHLKVPTLWSHGGGRGFSLGPVGGHWGRDFLLGPGRGTGGGTSCLVLGEGTGGGASCLVQGEGTGGGASHLVQGEWLRTRICLMPRGMFCFSQKVLECYGRGNRSDG